MAAPRVGVVGAGTMGTSLAQHLAQEGFEVVLVDVSEAILHRALEAVAASLDQRLEKWAITEAEKRVILKRITPSLSLEDAAPADLVIEAVTEDLELKKGIFRQLDALAPPDRLLASNTSTLSITEVAAATAHPDRVLGVHFVNPVTEMPVVEIIRGLHTSEESVAKARAFVERIDKVAVEVYESPGYVTTRLIMPLLNEAMYCVMEGVASPEDIDTAMRLGYRFRHGPLEMADRMGLDSLLIAMERLFREYGELKFRPCPLLKKYVRAGNLGVKTGRGFFHYDEEGRRLDAPGGRPVHEPGGAGKGVGA
ncbi:3-hydroxyacyl-CoA dehydrogenase family protein [Limnochorda pilosa]|uniref:3-hydroxybutyryl-CoA dehydrogenase n=1 Tax=Limnochorda pilosa TaxID=1555112 RepID=A0A0K2SPC6_LIMPI|nr:3-hydroxyacyl-CoA dehydrogenase NAD-binding domain-containing protein [Limnochorda pilosa]BAS28956.1 3-hydroxybutyryl-CoA dehydrogenase [Limnochorda pilosa]